MLLVWFLSKKPGFSPILLGVLNSRSAYEDTLVLETSQTIGQPAGPSKRYVSITNMRSATHAYWTRSAERETTWQSSGRPKAPTGAAGLLREQTKHDAMSPVMARTSGVVRLPVGRSRAQTSRMGSHARPQAAYRKRVTER